MILHRFFLIGIIFSMLSGCGDTPSDIGSDVQDRLAKQKVLLESNETKKVIERYISSQDRWSDDAKHTANSAFNFVRGVSNMLDPELAKDGIESSEMAIACALTLMRSDDETFAFIKNLNNSIDDDGARVELLKQIKVANSKVVNAAVKKENCL
jgi:hypothetical protein